MDVVVGEGKKLFDYCVGGGGSDGGWNTLTSDRKANWFTFNI